MTTPPSAPELREYEVKLDLLITVLAASPAAAERAALRYAESAVNELDDSASDHRGVLGVDIGSTATVTAISGTAAQTSDRGDHGSTKL